MTVTVDLEFKAGLFKKEVSQYKIIYCVPVNINKKSLQHGYTILINFTNRM